MKLPKIVSISENGFTLIELLVAILILMIGLLALLQSVNLAYSHNLITILRNEGVLLADEQMMIRKSMTFDRISSGTPLKIRRDMRSAFKNYSVIGNVTNLTDTSKEIVLRVSWKHKNQPYDHFISSIISQ